MRRFSLQTFLLLVMLCGALLALGTLQYRHWKLEAEVLDLRREGGHLVPSDLGRVNVIQVPTSNPNVLKWRIYAPPGTEFDGGLRVNKIPREGVPGSKPFSGVTIESVEHGVLCTLEVSELADESSEVAFNFGLGISFNDPKKEPLSEWWDRHSCTWETAGRDGVEVFDYDEPLVLHRCRMMDEPAGGGGWTTPEGNARGLLVWLIPRRKP